MLKAMNFFDCTGDGINEFKIDNSSVYANLDGWIGVLSPPEIQRPRKRALFFQMLQLNSHSYRFREICVVERRAFEFFASLYC